MSFNMEKSTLFTKESKSRITTACTKPRNCKFNVKSAWICGLCVGNLWNVRTKGTFVTVRVTAGEALEYFSVHHSTTLVCINLLRTAECLVYGEIKTYWTPTTTGFILPVNNEFCRRQIPTIIRIVKSTFDVTQLLQKREGLPVLIQQISTIRNTSLIVTI
jgi:hypothetical protein